MLSFTNIRSLPKIYGSLLKISMVSSTGFIIENIIEINALTYNRKGVHKEL